MCTRNSSNSFYHIVTRQNFFYAIKNRLVNRTIPVSIVIPPKGGSIDRRLIKWLHCVVVRLCELRFDREIT